jgi:hypothetical protein
LNLRTVKTPNLCLLLLICLAIGAGCKKDDQPGTVQQFLGTEADWPKLEAEFATSAPDVQNSFGRLKRFFRYGQLPQALVELDQLSKNPQLTEPQKKLISDLITQTKQKLNDAPPSPGQ